LEIHQILTYTRFDNGARARDRRASLAADRANDSLISGELFAAGGDSAEETETDSDN
jgi:hypothetical protein